LSAGFKLWLLTAVAVWRICRRLGWKRDTVNGWFAGSLLVICFILFLKSWRRKALNYSSTWNIGNRACYGGWELSRGIIARFLLSWCCTLSLYGFMLQYLWSFKVWFFTLYFQFIINESLSLLFFVLVDTHDWLFVPVVLARYQRIPFNSFKLMITNWTKVHCSSTTVAQWSVTENPYSLS
jgi:hypothetical protein